MGSAVSRPPAPADLGTAALTAHPPTQPSRTRRTSSTAAATQLPLAVDLDGTLISSDLLYESLVRLLRRNPLQALLLPIWLLRGKAHLKRQIAQRVSLDVRLLPYRADVLADLEREARSGRRLVLATSGDAIHAGHIASHLGIFASVLANDGKTNLKGIRKAAELKRLFGDVPFAYAGNNWSDLPVWAAAEAAIVVSRDQRLVRRVGGVARIERVYRPAGLTAWRMVRALRVNQWVKNLLVFVPLAAAHRVGEPSLIANATAAFVAFGLVASASYLINDLVDLDFDRTHIHKRGRPLASGEMDIRVALVAAPLLLVAGVAVGFAVTWALALTLLGYFAAAQAYTFYLKKIALADVFALAVLYTTRIVAGAVAVSVPISQWLLAFSVFFFLCLAFVKRYSELRALRATELQQAAGRGYLVTDLEMLAMLGAASGYIAVLVLALYINSPEVYVLYGTPDALWLVCLVIIYWVSRLWIIAHRGDMDDDPIVFALKDRTSYLAGAISAAAVIAATL